MKKNHGFFENYLKQMIDSQMGKFTLVKGHKLGVHWQLLVFHLWFNSVIPF